MSDTKLKNIIEAALLAAGKPLSIDQCLALFLDDEQPTRDDIREVIKELTDDYAERSIELKEVASGFRIQVKEDYSTWVSRLWTERPSRYSRALLETLSLMAYRQPITRGEIEDIRGVSVSTSIIKTLIERDWIKVVGHRDIPGKPAMYGTTKHFLDYFNLKKLDELPSLIELRDIDTINAELDLDIPAVEVSSESDQQQTDIIENDNGEDADLIEDPSQHHVNEQDHEASHFDDEDNPQLVKEINDEKTKLGAEA
jgi:segregation and condensation protein B